MSRRCSFFPRRKDVWRRCRKMFGNMDFGVPKAGETFVVNSKNPLVLKNLRN
ncbi:MAG: hypothetical protein L6V93_10760 [Clostridiales bacterium]|nr:MAG: hypothetical protein L6V93_10760 [Clostridiales bacterium]